MTTFMAVSAPSGGPAPEQAVATRLDPSNSEARIAGPFDLTERNLPSGSGLFESTRLDTDAGQQPLEATLREHDPPGSDSLPLGDSNSRDGDFA